MKKLILSLIVLAGFAGIVPQAEARDRHHDRHYYDRHRHRSHNYYHHDRHYPRYRSHHYYAPRVRYYESDYCAPRYYHSRPRFSFNFGF